jgi:hypothetical protein
MTVLLSIVHQRGPDVVGVTTYVQGVASERILKVTTRA